VGNKIKNGFAIFILLGLANAISFPERVRGQRQENCGKYWVGHFVIFSVQNACGGICCNFLVCGWQCGVLCVGNACRKHDIANLAKRPLVNHYLSDIRL